MKNQALQKIMAATHNRRSKARVNFRPGVINKGAYKLYIRSNKLSTLRKGSLSCKPQSFHRSSKQPGTVPPIQLSSRYECENLSEDFSCTISHY